MRVVLKIEAEVEAVGAGSRTEVENKVRHDIRAVLKDATLWPAVNRGKVTGLMITILEPDGR